MKLSKADARRALVGHHFRWGSLPEVFSRLRCVQFDPLAPVGCNHDLVLQARVKNYKIGDWQRLAYQKRAIYDGWDKQASLIPYSGWARRRIIHRWNSRSFQRIFEGHTEAVEAVLNELTERGPLLPRDFAFQQRKDEWTGSWYGPSLTKQTLRALWHSGQVMTHSRRGNNHVYDLTHRVVPAEFYSQPEIGEEDAIREILLDRAMGVGLISPSASAEMWAMPVYTEARRRHFAALADEGRLTSVDVEGVHAYASPDLLSELDKRRPPKRVVFLAPLDHVMWDRRMVNHLFGFDYIWEVYKPEHQRRWGYYVLPVLYGEKFVARAEFWSRSRTLEIRGWHWEQAKAPSGFWPAYAAALARFMAYAGAHELKLAEGIDPRLAEAA